MIRILNIIFILLCLLPQISFAKHLYKEVEYQTYWCNKNNGKLEYKLNDNTRVDCLLPDMAVEFDFASKWAECIGQALYYGQQTKRTPSCVLIMENRVKDEKYLTRLKYATEKIQDFKIFTLTPSMLQNRNKK